jgi:vacuolar-type H+-ATPase subunit I/STV1
LTEFKDRASRRQKLMSYELEKINSAIAECLSGSGNYEDLKLLRAEKAEIEEKAYFDSIQSLKAAIQALEAQRIADYDAEKVLQSQLEAAAYEVDEQAAILQEKRENHGTLNGLIFLKKTALDVSREEIRDKRVELQNLIRNKITEQI